MDKERAFTIIELLVVISIIALLSSIFLSGVTSFRAKARDSRRFVELNQIRQELLVYFNSNGAYPALPASCGSAAWSQSNSGPCWTDFIALFGGAMPQSPFDPINSILGETLHIYAYQPVKSGSGFRLVTVLETNSTPGDLCAAGGDGPDGFPDSFYCIGDNWQ